MTLAKRLNNRLKKAEEARRNKNPEIKLVRRNILKPIKALTRRLNKNDFSSLKANFSAPSDYISWLVKQRSYRNLEILAAEKGFSLEIKNLGFMDKMAEIDSCSSFEVVCTMEKGLLQANAKIAGMLPRKKQLEIFFSTKVGLIIEEERLVYFLTQQTDIKIEPEIVNKTVEVIKFKHLCQDLGLHMKVDNGKAKSSSIVKAIYAVDFRNS